MLIGEKFETVDELETGNPTYWIAIDRERKTPSNIVEGKPHKFWVRNYRFLPWSFVIQAKEFIERVYQCHADPAFREEARKILKAASDAEIEVNQP